mmetsp:Transcript_1802/g.6414  ORF Transcript_1802/g.6414 Transcript_1802/m.6414 type:complete len:225 (-) Transcript_1802:567-1241(-)
MALAHHFLEFADSFSSTVIKRLACVTRHRRKEVDCGISPKVGAIFASSRILCVVLHFVEFMDRQQLDAINTQALQVGKLLNHTLVCAWARHCGAGIGCEAPHMHLVDDQVFHFQAQRLVSLPIEIIFVLGHSTSQLWPRGIGRAHVHVLFPAYNCFRIGVQQDFCLVKALCHRYRLPSIDSVAIHKALCQIRQLDMPYGPCPVLGRVQGYLMSKHSLVKVWKSP